MVLAELCAQSGISFFLTHCNFKLRGEESERDEQFVRSLAAKYEVEVLVRSFDTEEYAAEKKTIDTVNGKRTSLCLVCPTAYRR